MNNISPKARFVSKIQYNPSDHFTKKKNTKIKNEKQIEEIKKVNIFLQNIIKKYTVELYFYQINYSIDRSEILENSEKIKNYLEQKEKIFSKIQIEEFLKIINSENIEILYPLLTSYETRIKFNDDIISKIENKLNLFEKKNNFFKK